MQDGSIKHDQYRYGLPIHDRSDRIYQQLARPALRTKRSLLSDHLVMHPRVIIYNG